jgi:glycosyltransferase involved in cell wall biosynthesis
MKILILTRYGQQGASSRLRFLQYFPWFESAAIEYVVSPLFDDSMLLRKYKHGGYHFLDFLSAYWRRIHALMSVHQFDLVWIEKEALPWFPAWLERWLLCRAPYVLDFDDAIFHNYDQHPNAWVRRLYGLRIDCLMAGARLILAGNPYLAQRARDAGAQWVEIIPTVIDLNRYPIQFRPTKTDTSITIVWIGSPYTAKYLDIIQEPLARLGERYPLRLRIIGGTQRVIPKVEVEVLAWSEFSEVADIQACDIGIMPLLDSPWERGKCGYKLIQYMACGLPVIASSVGINTDIIREDENGFLADSTEEWENALEKLIANAQLRQQMGQAGRQRVETDYCLQQVAPKLVSLFSTAEGKR